MEPMDDKTGELERAAKEGDLTLVSVNTPPFLEEARQLLSQIDNLLTNTVRIIRNFKKMCPIKKR